jgi:hypothetical protein
MNKIRYEEVGTLHEEMFGKEKLSSSTNTNFSVLNIFLYFLYLDLIRLAQQYQVKKLIKKCEQVLIDELNIDNAIPLCRQASSLNAKVYT